MDLARGVKTNTPAPPPARHATSNDWARWREELAHLWMVEHKTLEEIQDIMRRRHQKILSKKPLKTHFKEWGFGKNLSGPTKGAMLRIQRRRQEVENKRTKFTWKGQPVAQEKLDRFARSHQDLSGFAAATPPDVQYSTPPALDDEPTMQTEQSGSGENSALASSGDDRSPPGQSQPSSNDMDGYDQTSFSGLTWQAEQAYNPAYQIQEFSDLGDMFFSSLGETSAAGSILPQPSYELYNPDWNIGTNAGNPAYFELPDSDPWPSAVPGIPTATGGFGDKLDSFDGISMPAVADIQYGISQSVTRPLQYRIPTHGLTESYFPGLYGGISDVDHLNNGMVLDPVSRAFVEQRPEPWSLNHFTTSIPGTSSPGNSSQGMANCHDQDIPDGVDLVRRCLQEELERCRAQYERYNTMLDEFDQHLGRMKVPQRSLPHRGTSDVLGSTIFNRRDLFTQHCRRLAEERMHSQSTNWEDWSSSTLQDHHEAARRPLESTIGGGWGWGWRFRGEHEPRRHVEDQIGGTEPARTESSACFKCRCGDLSQDFYRSHGQNPHRPLVLFDKWSCCQCLNINWAYQLHFLLMVALLLLRLGCWTRINPFAASHYNIFN
ncbi:hypothetical protein JX265_007688 [Neoarthrinium moseri]|uniref:Clr5 domain-containing protein n=1 Tax=Neoarthrinium moseri TaxID=1658444 RepID=A0A9P9WJ95_9PEZI|nr:hypothetical protein JX265_007688 [Neoarthrinium moseri]